MAERYSDEVEFLMVYIREAHPTDGRQTRENIRDGIELPAPTTLEQKEEHAELCVTKLAIRFTAVVDGMDHRVEQRYAAWPDRLYLVDKDGRISYKSRPGPRGFVASELEQAIRSLAAAAAGGDVHGETMPD